MTKAVCVRCGSMKFGAFNPCGACGFVPEDEIDVTYSLTLTDHYFDVGVLEQISADMRSGKPRPSLPKEQEDQMREGARLYIEKFKPAPITRKYSACPDRGEERQIGRIRVHPRGHTTDYRVVRRLEQTTPRSHRKAQDVLVAAKKYVKGPGIFRSQRSLILKLQEEIYALEDALREEGYRFNLQEQQRQLLFSYLSEFSDAYPNWQAEYTALSKFIPHCFPQSF